MDSKSRFGFKPLKQSEFKLSDEMYEFMVQDIKILVNREKSLEINKQLAEEAGLEISPPEIVYSEPNKISISHLPSVIYWFEGREPHLVDNMNANSVGMRNVYLVEVDDKPAFCYNMNDYDKNEIYFMIFYNGEEVFEDFKSSFLKENPKVQFISRKRAIFEWAVGYYRQEVAQYVEKTLEGHNWLRRAFEVVEGGISRLAYRRTMELTNTECRMCGVCCERLQIATPDFKKKRGERCPNLTADNLCSIFEDRPSVCRDWPNLKWVRVRADPVGLLVDMNTCPIVRDWWHNLSFVLTGIHPTKYKILRMDGTREGKRKTKKKKKQRALKQINEES